MPFLGVLAVKTGVGDFYSKSRGRGRKNFSGGFAITLGSPTVVFHSPLIQNMLRGPCGQQVVIDVEQIS